MPSSAVYYCNLATLSVLFALCPLVTLCLSWIENKMNKMLKVEPVFVLARTLWVSSLVH